MLSWRLVVLRCLFYTTVFPGEGMLFKLTSKLSIVVRLIGFALLVCGLSACSREAPILTGATMGTTYSVIVPKLKSSDQDILQAQVEAVLSRVNSAMSTYQTDSSISLFNNSPTTDWFVVPEEFAYVAEVALQIASDTNGAFDPTVGPLVNRWGFGKDQSDAPPEAEEITSLLAQVGYESLQVDVDKKAVKKSNAELQVDLNAIAKGYAVDLLAEVVAGLGYGNFLVEIGGELRVSGKNNKAQPWRVGVESPTIGATGTEDPPIGLLLEHGGVATSGDYRNAFESDGVRYSHLIDPRNGSPVSHKLASVTIVADTAMRADAWATALMVLGPDEGLKVAESRGIAAYFIERADDGFATFGSTEFARLARSP